MTFSDKIDKIVTNRWLGLPIFAVVIALVYFLAMAPFAPGTLLTGWANDGLFGDGWHLFGIGSGAYGEASEEYGDAANVIDAFIGLPEEPDVDAVKAGFAEVEPAQRRIIHLKMKRRWQRKMLPIHTMNSWMR